MVPLGMVTLVSSTRYVLARQSGQGLIPEGSCHGRPGRCRLGCGHLIDIREDVQPVPIHRMHALCPFIQPLASKLPRKSAIVRVLATMACLAFDDLPGVACSWLAATLSLPRPWRWAIQRSARGKPSQKTPPCRGSNGKSICVFPLFFGEGRLTATIGWHWRRGPIYLGETEPSELSRPRIESSVAVDISGCDRLAHRLIGPRDAGVLGFV